MDTNHDSDVPTLLPMARTLPPMDNEPSTTPNTNTTPSDCPLSVGLCLDTKVLLSTVIAYLENSNVQCNFDISTPKKHMSLVTSIIGGSAKDMEILQARALVSGPAGIP
jgi:hypothetical protein